MIRYENGPPHRGVGHSSNAWQGVGTKNNDSRVADRLGLIHIADSIRIVVADLVWKAAA
jgi:hypothetical protein